MSPTQLGRQQDPDEADRGAYQGEIRRLCPHCGVEVVVQRPTRVLGRDSNPAWRRAFRKELARQILFEALCDGPNKNDGCRQWWNGVLARVEHPDPVIRAVAERARRA